MSKRVLIRLSEDVLVEITPPPPETGSQVSTAIEKVKGSVDQIKKVVVPVANAMKDTWAELNKDLNMTKAEVEIKLGFEIGGDIYLARGNATANLSVKLFLEPKKP
jgi:hypothetical protein